MAANTQARTISANAASNKGILDITSLVLLAILLATGFILNMTVGNALAATGIKPQFIIAAYALRHRNAPRGQDAGGHDAAGFEGL